MDGKGGLQTVRVNSGAEFHQFLEIDDLVVAPITDIGPGIIRFWNFPIDPVISNPIRVISTAVVAFGKVAMIFSTISERIRERFPILENVSPVSFIIEAP